MDADKAGRADGNADEHILTVADVGAADEGLPDTTDWDAPEDVAEDEARDEDVPIAVVDASVTAGDTSAWATGDDAALQVEVPADPRNSDGAAGDVPILEAGQPVPEVAAVRLDGGTLDGSSQGDAGTGDAPAFGADSAATDSSLPDASSGDTGPLPHIWVYVMAGQSNMEGVGANSELLPQQAQLVPDAEIYYESPLEVNTHLRRWLPIGPGFGWADAYFGPELTFARRFHEIHPDRHLAIIKVCEGNTALYDRWKAPAGDLYQFLLRTVVEQLAALSARGRPQIAGFLWMQGEADLASASFANAYQQNLLDLVHGVRADIGVELMPVVAGLIATDLGSPYAKTVRDGTTLASTMIGQMGVVETDDLPMAINNVGHYGTAGQLQLGARFADTADTLLGTQWKFPDGYGGVTGESCFTYRERAGAEATPMAFDATSAYWVGKDAAVAIGKGWMLPGAKRQAELAWWAPYAGTFRVAIRASVPDVQSAGSVVEISDGTQVLWGPQEIPPGGVVMTGFSRKLEQKGELHFRTAPGLAPDPSHDRTSWEIEIDTTWVSR